MDDGTTKRCSKCGQEFPATREFFSPGGKKSDGWKSHCKKCSATYIREKRRSQGAKAHGSNLVNGMKRCSKCNEWKPATRECFPPQKKTRDKLDSHCKDCHRNHARQYRQHNHDKVVEAARIWRANNPENSNRASRDWEERNLEKMREYGRLATLRRKARKKALPDTLSAEEWERCLEWWGNRCAYCGACLELHNPATTDHFIPLSSATCPGTTATNCIPACLSCNSKKGKKAAEQWLIERFGSRKAKQILARIKAYFEWVATQD